MRLIDADTINGTFVRNETYRGSEVMALLDQQPTAHDVDNIVKQLELCESVESARAAENDEAGRLDLMEMHDAAAAAYRNSIRIVEGGGMDEEDITDSFQ